MKPVSPVIPGLEKYEVEIAKDQDEYGTLPALPMNGGEYILTSWKLTWRDRFFALVTGDIYLSIWTFGRSVQPVLLEAGYPENACRELAATEGGARQIWRGKNA
jgi:hypothetical protein